MPRESVAFAYEGVANQGRGFAKNAAMAWSYFEVY